MEPEPLNVLSASTLDNLLEGDSVDGDVILTVGGNYWIVRQAGTWLPQ
jgi:hypothetical protein